jgi:hypothetical protein
MMINHPLTLLECEGKARDWKMGKNPKKPQNKFLKNTKLGGWPIKTGIEVKLKLFSNNKLKKECWCQVGDDAERV